MCSAHNRVKRLVRSIVSQSVEALNVFINQVWISLVDCYLTGLGGAYIESVLSCTYTLKLFSGTGATSVKMQTATYDAGDKGYGADPSLIKAAPPKPCIPPRKGVSSLIEENIWTVLFQFFLLCRLLSFSKKSFFRLSSVPFRVSPCFSTIISAISLCVVAFSFLF